MSDTAEQWRAFFQEHVKQDTALVRGYLAFIDQCIVRNLPIIFEERHLSRLIGVDYRDMAFYFTSSGGRYRQFRIPKRLGGTREINVPSPLLLAIQQWILRNVLYKLPITDAAHGGVPGRSIITNAGGHLGARSVLKMDLRGFFDTILLPRGVAIFESAGYSPHLSRSLALLCFEGGRLPQGAATSPALANLAAVALDGRLEALAQKFGLIYSRYVDDLTFSGHSIGVRFSAIVQDIVEDTGFVVNSDKTRLMRGQSPKFVTGLAVGGGRLRVPRAFKRDVRNRAFQLAKRGVERHLEATESSDPLVLEQVTGQLAFWLQVEPESKTARQLFDALTEYRRGMTTSVKLPDPRRVASIDDSHWRVIRDH
ncbi:reverse transcriptase family protein [Sphingomonas sp. Leaf205]|uniref:reverse transcriptase family protein n=1 Tax=Sphingomonas sp. Leaf205 TaxID=2876551 RepID=UPI001E4A4244|nr:reverse transcriptase family protein [Sphingomonas sp. Leaf205]